MPDCPRCHQPVSPQEIVCPYCRAALKAHGHPGIPLYRASGDEPLCLSCTYHADDTCNFPKRPHAMDCTLYQDLSQQSLLNAQQPGYTTSFRVKTWFKRNVTLLALVGLILISFVIVLLQS